MWWPAVSALASALTLGRAFAPWSCRIELNPIQNRYCKNSDNSMCRFACELLLLVGGIIICCPVKSMHCPILTVWFRLWYYAITAMIHWVALSIVVRCNYRLSHGAVSVPLLSKEKHTSTKWRHDTIRIHRVGSLAARCNLLFRPLLWKEMNTSFGSVQWKEGTLSMDCWMNSVYDITCL